MARLKHEVALIEGGESVRGVSSVKTRDMQAMAKLKLVALLKECTGS